MSTQFEQLADYPTLTDSQRIQARNNARRNIIAKFAKKPVFEQFQRTADNDYPRYVVIVVSLFMLALLLAAFVPSAYRVFKISSDTFSRSISQAGAGSRAGYAFIMLAETGQIGFTLAAGVLKFERQRDKYALYVAALISTALALVGNVQIALGARWLTAFNSDTFAWIEAYTPPILVIFSATVLKHFLLSDIRRNHAANQAYYSALLDYNKILADPEQHPEWRNMYGAALWEMWTKVYQRESVEWMIDRDTKQLIALREMGLDAFFADEIAETFRKQPKGERETTVSQTEVIAYLRANPDAQDLKGKEIAEITGASAATVSRAIQKFQKNGHER